MPSSWGWEKPVTCFWPVEGLSHNWREESEKEPKRVSTPSRATQRLFLASEPWRSKLPPCVLPTERTTWQRRERQAASSWQPIESQGAQTCSHKDVSGASSLNELEADSFPGPPSENPFLPTPRWHLVRVSRGPAKRGLDSWLQQRDNRVYCFKSLNAW